MCRRSLQKRFKDDSFTQNHCGSRVYVPPFKNKFINIENKNIKLRIWDHETTYDFFKNTICEKADGIIFVYDITDYISFNKIPMFIKNASSKVKTNLYKILVGNKCDKEKEEREVTEEQGKKLAEEFNMNFFETSCLTNQNVNEVFNFLVSKIVKKKIQNDESNDNKILLNNNNKQEEKNGCW